MCKELIRHLKLNKGATILDCTVGCGGHADAILREIGPQGRLLGIDQDGDALKIAEDRLKEIEQGKAIVQTKDQFLKEMEQWISE